MIVKVGKEVVLSGDEAQVAADLVIVALGLAKAIGAEKAKRTLELAVELVEEQNEKNGKKSDGTHKYHSDVQWLDDIVRRDFFV